MIWDRIKRIGRRKLITGVVTVGLAVVGVNLPPETVGAVVTALDVVMDAVDG